MDAEGRQPTRSQSSDGSAAAEKIENEAGRRATAQEVSVGAEALWRAFNDDRPLPPELRPDHEKAARAVLDAVLSPPARETST